MIDDEGFMARICIFPVGFPHLFFSPGEKNQMVPELSCRRGKSIVSGRPGEKFIAFYGASDDAERLP